MCMSPNFFLVCPSSLLVEVPRDVLLVLSFFISIMFSRLGQRRLLILLPILLQLIPLNLFKPPTNLCDWTRASAVLTTHILAQFSGTFTENPPSIYLFLIAC